MFKQSTILGVGVLLGYITFSSVAKILGWFDPNGLSAVANIGLLICAIFALNQLEQSRNELAVKELKDFAKILEDFDFLMEDMKTKGYVPYLIEMEDYTMLEFGSLDKSTKKWQALKDSYTYFKKYPKDETRLLHVANRLEAICLAFNQNVGSLKLVKDTVAIALCSFVEISAMSYIKKRHGAYLLYKETIELYKKVRLINGTHKDQEEAFKASLGL